MAGALFFVFLFLFCEGYEYGTGNQTVFVPVIESRIQFPHLQADFGVSTHALYHPFFNEAMARLGTLMPLPLVFLVMQTALLVFLYAVLRKFSVFFRQSAEVFWLAVLLMFLWGQQGADGNVFWTNRLEAQYLAWPVLLLAFISYLRGNFARAGLWLGLACLAHFQLGLIAAAVLFSSCFFPDPLPRRSRWLHMTAGFALVGLPVVIFFVRSFLADKALWGPDFMAFAHMRATHHMAWNSRLGLLFLLLGLLPMALEKAWSAESRQALKRLILLQSLMLVFGALHYADYYLQWGFLARLQFLRLLPFVYVSGVFFTAWLLLEILKSEKLVLRLAACFLIFAAGPRLIGFRSLSQNWIYIASSFLSLALVGVKRPKRPLALLAGLGSIVLLTKILVWVPGQRPVFTPPVLNYDTSQTRRDDWAKICRSASHWVPKEALVLTPPDKPGFVFLSKRCAFVEFKSGANHRRTFKEWRSRLELAMGGRSLSRCSGTSACMESIRRGYEALDEEKIAAISRAYGIGFFISSGPGTYPYEKLAASGPFNLYRLPKIPSVPFAESNSAPLLH